MIGLWIYNLCLGKRFWMYNCLCPLKLIYMIKQNGILEKCRWNYSWNTFNWKLTLDKICDFGCRGIKKVVDFRFYYLWYHNCYIYFERIDDHEYFDFLHEWHDHSKRLFIVTKLEFHASVAKRNHEEHVHARTSKFYCLRTMIWWLVYFTCFF